MSVEISPEVQRGVEWLDNQTPGWDGINPDSVFIADDCACVCAHVYGIRFSTFLAETNRTWDWATQHGFTQNENNGFSDLTFQWRQVIRERQNKNEAA